MLWVQDWKTPASEFDAEKLLKLQLGAVSPMWLAFAGVATMGAAIWSASHWMRLANAAQPAAAETPPAKVEAPAPALATVTTPAVAAPALAAQALAVAAPQAPARQPAKVKAATPVADKIDGRTKAARAAKAARLAQSGAATVAKPAAGKHRAKARAAR